MDKYFLVSPHVEDDRSKKYFYWMKENEGYWLQFVHGIWRPKQGGDIIKLCARAEDTTLLDWSGTWLSRPESTAGWLNRGGRFFGCPSNYHDQLAAYVIGVKVSEAENGGWVRVKDSRYYDCLKNLSAEQKNWLSEKGYKLYD